MHVKTGSVIKLAVAVLAVVGLVLVWQQYKNEPKSQQASTRIRPHFFNEPATSLSNIKLRVFYAVPKNFSNEIKQGWKENIIRTTEEAVKFHEVQFHSSSKLMVDIYPQLVILENDNIAYDTENTNYGNPEGLRRIVPELKKRFPDFVRTSNDEFGVIAVIYEGVGAAGMPGSMILSNTYLESDEYAQARITLFYHEFGHTIGLPDKYDYESSEPTINDIMGGRRFEPIETNYIDPSLLKEFGVFIQ